MWMVVVASLIVVTVVYYFFYKSRQFSVKDDLFSYRAKEFLLSRTEKALYDTICRYIKTNKLKLKVFPRVRLTDFIWSPKDNRNAYLRISGKFVDFLIVEEQSLKPLAAIFITNEESRPKMFSLQVIEPALSSCNIELLTVSASEVFHSESVSQILEKIGKLGG